MKGLLTVMMVFLMTCTFAQKISGTWQVVKESNCLGEEFSDPSETEEELLESMSSLATGTPKTIQFNLDGSGQENWRTQGRKKPNSKEKFLYRFTNETVYFLDKRSRLISNTFIIEELTSTTLVMFNKDRSCERLELTRIN